MATRWRLVYDGDGEYIGKDRRILQLTEEIQDKVDAIPWVVDNLTGTSTIDALSANMGRVLQEQIDNLSALWHFLSGWNCSTGLPTTNPRVDPYVYKTGDYYRVTAIWETNYKPHWWTYNQGVASTAVELWEVEIWDWYMYDGGVWTLIKQWWGTGGWAYFKTQAEYDALPDTKNSDWNLYIIVDSHVSWLPRSDVLDMSDALAYLNQKPLEAAEYYASTWDVVKIDEAAEYWVTLPEWKYIVLYMAAYQIVFTNLTAAELIQYFSIPQSAADTIVETNWVWTSGGK